MGFFDDVLGTDMFDFNGDGKTSWEEEMIGFKIIEEVCGEDESESFDSDDFCDNF